MTPFLEIVTRCYKRPAMLADNRAALARLADPDWRQTLLLDDVGIGVAAANARLASVDPVGRYVWVLDDDDLCTYDGLLSDLKDIAEAHDPDVFFVRFGHAWMGILPNDYHWRCQPDRGCIGGSSVIVSAETWRQHRHRWATGQYSSDYDFVRSVYDAAQRPYWHDVVAGKVQRISQGAPE